MHLKEVLGGSKSSKSNDAIRFQVMSDLHLEAFDLYASFDIPRAAPCLILAGDVGRFSSYAKLLGFFERQCQVFDHVYYVLGNHEYYGLNRQRCLDLAREIEKEEVLKGRLTLLDTTRVDLENGVTILGCTLWSHVPEESEAVIREKVSDFRGYITDWTVDRHNEVHAEEVAWLKQQIEMVHDEQVRRKILVVTHHAPSYHRTSAPKDDDSPLSPAFATELIDDEIGAWRGHDMISHWLFGHTHHSCEIIRNGITMVANQHGYFPITTSTEELTSKYTSKLVSLFSKNKGGLSFDVSKCIALK